MPSNKSLKQVGKFSIMIFVAFGLIAPFLSSIIEYQKVVFNISLWTVFILIFCAVVVSFVNVGIFLILKKTPPNHKEGLIGGIIGAIAFFFLATLEYFSLYDESQYKTFIDFIFHSYLSPLTLILLFAGVVQGIIGGYYIGSKIKSILGSLLIGFVVYVMFYVFFAFGGH